MRLLDKGRMALNLANCGMLPDNYNTFKQQYETSRQQHCASSMLLN